MKFASPCVLTTMTTIVACILATNGRAESKAKPSPAPTSIKALMHEKLESAHGILEGLVMEDFTKIEHFAAQLHDISRATTWQKPDDAEFLRYAKNFQGSADYLVEQARKKNLDGVAIGHIRVTMDCMQCHNFVRAGRQP